MQDCQELTSEDKTPTVHCRRGTLTRVQVVSLMRLKAELPLDLSEATRTRSQFPIVFGFAFMLELSL